MNHEKYAKDVYEAFKRSSNMLDQMKNDLRGEILEMNFSILFGECAIALVKAGFSREQIRHRLEIEFSIYDNKK